jgi:hypothetical protein
MTQGPVEHGIAVIGGGRILASVVEQYQTAAKGDWHQQTTTPVGPDADVPDLACRSELTFLRLGRTRKPTNDAAQNAPFCLPSVVGRSSRTCEQNGG